MKTSLFKNRHVILVLFYRVLQKIAFHSIRIDKRSTSIYMILLSHNSQVINFVKGNQTILERKTENR